MATVNITDVCDDLTTLFGAMTGIVRSYSYDELPEAHNELPAVEVYPNNGEATPHAFQGGVYRNSMVIFADVYASKRSNLPDDVGAAVPYIDRGITALEGDNDLGDTVKGMVWAWTRALFERSGVEYSGVRFTITVEVF